MDLTRSWFSRSGRGARGLRVYSRDQYHTPMEGEAGSDRGLSQQCHEVDNKHKQYSQLHMMLLVQSFYVRGHMSCPESHLRADTELRSQISFD